VLYLCIKYIDDPELSMTASVNLGGDASNRTALIGAMMGDAIRHVALVEMQQTNIWLIPGAAHGYMKIPFRWRSRIRDKSLGEKLDQLVHISLNKSDI
jgi:hypothetical protein